MIEIKHRFTNAVLYRSESATTIREALTEAVHVRADLARAGLARADLAGADLAYADLARADLGDQWIVQGAIRADGYPFFLQQVTRDRVPMVKAGCRLFPLPEARTHWNRTRGGTPLGNETIAIIDSMVALAKIRGKM